MKIKYISIKQSEAKDTWQIVYTVNGTQYTEGVVLQSPELVSFIYGFNYQELAVGNLVSQHIEEVTGSLQTLHFMKDLAYKLNQSEPTIHCDSEDFFATVDIPITDWLQFVQLVNGPKTYNGNLIPLEVKGILYLCDLDYENEILWVRSERMYTSQMDALNAYSNIPNPESQLMLAGKDNTRGHLLKEVDQLHKNMHNNGWIQDLKASI